MDNYIFPEKLSPLPVPSARYIPSADFINSTLASLSDGNVSMGLGKVTTSKGHGDLFNSLKIYFNKLA
ncbi:MAG: hypothetical protein Q8R95_14335 [Azonexus sp.]|nr:hypothetical protein [Azonexus sp.]